jgi:hypothetical protein
MTDLTVANTIWQQIDLNTKMAVGARSPLGDDNSLTFGVLSGKRSFVKVTLEPSDTYTVEFIKVGNAPNYKKTLVTRDDVYCDNLASVIYDLCCK